MDLPAAGQFDTMKAVEARQQCVRIALDVLVVLLEDRPEEFVFGMRDGLDDEPIIAGKVEEGTRFPRRSQLGENVLGSEREQVVRWIQVEVLLAKVSEYPWRVILEFEVVLGGRSELVADAVRQL